MKEDFLVTNVKYFYVFVSPDYSDIKRIAITKECFERAILPYLALGFGCVGVVFRIVVRG